MKINEERTNIIIRIPKDKKNAWKKICKSNGNTLTDLIINSVENKILNGDRIEIIKFIEKQSNVFSKIENNINQIAKTVNTEKTINNNLMEFYNVRLGELNNLKIEQNEIFKKIYNLLAR